MKVGTRLNKIELAELTKVIYIKGMVEICKFDMGYVEESLKNGNCPGIKQEKAGHHHISTVCYVEMVTSQIIMMK